MVRFIFMDYINGSSQYNYILKNILNLQNFISIIIKKNKDLQYYYFLIIRQIIRGKNFFFQDTI